MAKKGKRNYTWLTRQVWLDECTCDEGFERIGCSNKDCECYTTDRTDDNGEEIESNQFQPGSAFKCQRCGSEQEITDIDYGDCCRCFTTRIAKRPINFCMAMRVCNECFMPHYSRIHVKFSKKDACCEETVGWRIYQGHPFDCDKKIFTLPEPGTFRIDKE
jgi:hypothetical protein